MRYVTMVSFLALSNIGQAQKPVLTTDDTLAIPKVTFDSSGQLRIAASTTSSQNDFDFLVGRWKMHNRRLNKRLEGCNDWTEFDSSDDNSKILSGSADMDAYSTTEMPGQEGKLVEGVLCPDTFKGRQIIMMFRWDARDKEHPVWSRAFSPDNGKTWEWNWYNVSERIK
jgi:hypothetical protein